MQGKTFIQVLVPLKLDWIPWYSTTESLSVGDRVSVRVGRGQYVGVVWEIGGTPGIPLSRILPICGRADGLDPVSQQELELWRFVSEYYLCTPGEVYKAAYPALRTRSELGAAATRQKAEERRGRLLQSINARIGRLESELRAKDDFLSGLGSKAVKARESALRVRAGIAERLEAARNSAKSFDTLSAPRLETAPAAARKASAPLLLWSENRIPRYLEAIRSTLERGYDALVLVPGTEFCDSLQNALEDSFGAGNLKLHNMRQSTAGKRRIAQSLRNPESPEVVLGTRSAIFLPWKRLGLVIVDEEQDAAFKQQDPAPRYNARDLAVKLASIHGADVILGTSCPSLESLYNALGGKYGMERPARNSGADTFVIDLSAERRKNGVYGYFSRKAIERIRSFGGPVTLVRGWEDGQRLEEEFTSLFPDREYRILTAFAARRCAPSEGLTCVLQADHLSGKDDFRADEKALQILSSLKSKARLLVVQTANGEHPLYRALQESDPGYLLEERRAFSLPPYVRIADIRNSADGSVAERIIIERGARGKEKRGLIASRLGAGTYADVDPL